MNPKRNNKRKIQVKKKIHNTAHRMVRPNLTCDVCDRVFHSPPLLHQHQVEYRHWECFECGDLFYTAMERDYHKEKLGHYKDSWSEEESQSEEEMSEYGEEIQRSGSPIITYDDDTVTFISGAEGGLPCPDETEAAADSLVVQQEEQPVSAGIAASLAVTVVESSPEAVEHHTVAALEPRQGEEQPVLQEVVDPGQGEEQLSSVAATQTDGAVKKQSSPEGMEKLQKERAKCAAVVAVKPVGMQVQLNNWKQQHAAPVPTAFAPTPGAFGVTAIQLELKKKQSGEQSSAELTNVLVEQPGPRRVSLLEQKPSPG